MQDSLQARIFAHPLYQLSLRGRIPGALTQVPPRLWPGNPERGRALLAAVGDGDAAPWDEEPERHAFDWIADLTAVGLDDGRDLARELVSRWIPTHLNWQLPSWRAGFIGRRLTNWLVNFDYLSTADGVFETALLRSAAGQARHLTRIVTHPRDAAERLQAIKGLIYCGVCLPGFVAALKRGLNRLEHEVDQQILPDGCHFERNPSRQLMVLVILIEIRAALIHGHIEVPDTLQGAIDRMAPMLRCFRHGDGKLALFNGADEEDDAFIDLALREGKNRGKALSAAPHGGFHRLKAGRTLIIADVGQPLASGHAGSLSFEFSVGKHRMVVNCGAAVSTEALWHEALRNTAAHSTVTVDGVNSLELIGPGDKGKRQPTRVPFMRREIDRHLLLESNHDGYAGIFGIVHQRSFFLAADGCDMRGEDLLTGTGTHPFVARFHLHPEVQASLVEGAGAVLLKLPDGQGWRFRASGGDVAVEDSVYHGSGVCRRSHQIVVSSCHDGPESIVKWRFNREIRKTKKEDSSADG